MGGESSFTWMPSSEDESSPGQDFQHKSVEYPFSRDNDEGSSAKRENGSAMNGESGLKKILGLRQKRKVHAEVLKSYECQIERLQEAKSKILSYTPGSWLEKTGDMVCDKYNIPKTTSLLLIGPKASGKSSLVNKISEVLENCPFLSRRAQVSSSQLTEDGTCFVNQYMVPRFSGTVCLYDTRSLSDDKCENLKEIKRWMTKGVRHGELVLRDSDPRDLKVRLKVKARHSCSSNQLRMINFVIFVVNGVSVLEAMNDDNDLKKKSYQEMATIFNNPLLSFKDDKPAVVVTHGDLLSISDRVRARVYLGELFGIPPTQQIFDIPDKNDHSSALATVDMLTHCLEHADRNLPVEERFLDKILGYSFMGRLLLLMLLAMAVVFQVMDITLRTTYTSQAKLDQNRH